MNSFFFPASLHYPGTHLRISTKQPVRFSSELLQVYKWITQQKMYSLLAMWTGWIFQCHALNAGILMQAVCRIIWTSEQFHHASTSSEDRYDSHGFCVNLLHSSIISAGILSRLSFQPCQRGDHAFERSDNSNGLEFVRWETFTGDTWSHFPNIIRS